MARKKKHAEHVNHERWLVSYADFITLLFATFVALYAISNIEKAKLAQLSQSLKTAFGGGGGAGASIKLPAVSMSGGADAEGNLLISIIPGASTQLASGAAGKENSDAADPFSNALLGGASEEETGDEDGRGAAEPESEPTPAPTPGSEPEATPTATPTPTPTPAPGPGGTRLGTEGSDNPALLTELQEMFQDAGLDKSVEVRQENRGTVISLGEAAFFALGDVEVLPQSIHQLDKIINVLRTRKFQIRVEGHTDNTPITSRRFRTNYELSVMRATRIVEFMVQHYNYDPKLLSPSGYGEFRPIADNSTADGRQKNRRVDIVILNEASSRFEPRAEPAAS